MDQRFKELKKIVKYISAILHQSHYPHLHRRLSRDDILNLNRLRKMFFEIISSNKDYLHTIREDSSIFMCRETIKFLNEGEFPDTRYEEMFELIENIYNNMQFDQLMNLREELNNLDSARYMELVEYWKIRDERMYYIINIIANIDNIDKTIQYLEKLKELDKDYTRVFLSKLDKKIIRTIGGAYE